MSAAAAPEDDHRGNPAEPDRQAEATEPAGGLRCGKQRRHIGANGDETGDTDIEEAGLAPLHIEAETDDPVSERRHQEEGGISEDIEHQVRAPKRPEGLTSSTAIRMRKAIAAR